ncbi:MAG: DoxX family protein [Deltaproteobacteria bacterium]|nr:DoxX family protein [Deltaproteobacteria bacterium]
MSKAPLIARILLGLIFFVFGLNGFLNFIPVPPMPEKTKAFMDALMATGYFIPVLKGTEVTCGLLLLVGAFVPLALVVLAPIVIQIFLFHAFIQPNGIPMALFIGALMIYLSFFAKPYASIVRQIFRCPMKEAMDAKKKG